MKNKRILIDCDGVLLDWIHGFEAWFKETYDKELEPETEGVYKVEHRAPGFTTVDAEKLVTEFNRSEYIRNLSAFRDSQKYVAKMYEMGYTFHCITAIEDSPEIFERRWENLKTKFGPAVEKLTLVGLMTDKIHHLTKYRNTGRFWIEDSVENAKDGHELGLETILIKHGHSVNFSHPDIHPVDTWEEIFNLVIKSEKTA